MTSLCHACGRPLRDERSTLAGYGRVCAARRGVVWQAETARAEVTRRPARTRRRRAEQLALPLDGPDLTGWAPAAWAWLRAHWERTHRDPRRSPDCEACRTYGLCARCAGYPSRRTRAPPTH
jgi:hypothetical protein